MIGPTLRSRLRPASGRQRRLKVMAIFGTRPEAIKMAPVVRALEDRADEFQTHVVVTAQHRAMLDQVLSVFRIEPDEDLDIMAEGQSLTDITVRALEGVDAALARERPDLVLVQGDTTSAFAGSLAAFYRQIPVGHVEAGLRTRNKYAPFPEEMNRHFIDVLADLCFAPTLRSKQALVEEGTPEDRILVTGNTVIDALLEAAGPARSTAVPALDRATLPRDARVLLVTAHRRENLGEGIDDLCRALRQLATSRSDLLVVFPVHLNPRVRESVRRILGGLDRVLLLEPLDYLEFVHAMIRSDVILTDSGGIQEEAPALGKPVLVARAVTERPEAIEAGTARLVGTDAAEIVGGVSALLDDDRRYAEMQRAVNPFGDGRAAERIAQAVAHWFGIADEPPHEFRVGQPLSAIDSEEGEDVAAVGR
jgi:UDP-N-acetylglucosamine 2-epimerase (non-hydrolysing)